RGSVRDASVNSQRHFRVGRDEVTAFLRVRVGAPTVRRSGYSSTDPAETPEAGLTTTAEPSSAESPILIEPTPIVTRPFPTTPPAKGSMFLRVLHTTDHKLIGRMYLVTSFAYFMIGGVLALLMRAELARPGMQFLSPEQYNQLFTMHGTIMLLFF